MVDYNIAHFLFYFFNNKFQIFSETAKTKYSRNFKLGLKRKLESLFNRSTLKQNFASALKRLARYAQVLFVEKPQNQFSKLQTLISNLYLTRT